VAPAAADRVQLQEVLRASGVVSGARPLTGLQDGHLLLFDMLVPGAGWCQALFIGCCCLHLTHPWVAVAWVAVAWVTDAASWLNC